MSSEELLRQNHNANSNAGGAVVDDRPDWEVNLPPSVQKSIADYLQGEKDQVLYLDCLWGELYGSINAHFWAGGITEEQANYLRKKYLFGDEEDDGPDIGMNQLQNLK